MTDAMMDRDVGPYKHDPGGKIRLSLQPGVRGSALFSGCGRYRPVLVRNWAELGSMAYYALWIAMNPSTAEHDVDDPTIRKGIHFTRSMGLTCYVMCNIMDYRSTNPKALSAVNPRSDANLPKIVELAAGASRIICAWGALPKPLHRYADDVVLALRGYPLYCMGKTAAGFPRHPLYLPNNAECVPWP